MAGGGPFGSTKAAGAALRRMTAVLRSIAGPSVWRGALLRARPGFVRARGWIVEPKNALIRGDDTVSKPTGGPLEARDGPCGCSSRVLAADGVFLGPSSASIARRVRPSDSRYVFSRWRTAVLARRSAFEAPTEPVVPQRSDLVARMSAPLAPRTVRRALRMACPRRKSAALAPRAAVPSSRTAGLAPRAAVLSPRTAGLAPRG
jgi:hypothetical protein